MTHQSPPSSLNDYHLELQAYTLTHVNVLFKSLEQDEQHSIVTATSSTVPAFDCSKDYSLQGQGIPETLEDSPLSQELLHYGYPEHFPSYDQNPELPTNTQGNNSQAQVSNLYIYIEVCPIIYVIFL